MTKNLSDAEWTVMNVVWDLGPVTARQVLHEIEGETGWAYSTVKTILERLAEKGVVEVERQGNAGVFSAALPRETAQQSALRSLLDRAFDGTFGALLQHLVSRERLSRKDREQLAAMLEAHEYARKSGRRKSP